MENGLCRNNPDRNNRGWQFLSKGNVSGLPPVQELPGRECRASSRSSETNFNNEPELHITRTNGVPAEADTTG